MPSIIKLSQRARRGAGLEKALIVVLVLALATWTLFDMATDATRGDVTAAEEALAGGL